MRKIINIFSVILVIVTISKMFPLSFSAEENDNYDITLLGKDEEKYVTITTTVYNDITELHLIDNADYFKVNPLHKDNDYSDNSKETCTTVAMQMVMGYHNYYSDRRIIPENTIYNTTFLDKDFGKLEDHPLINTTVAFNLGKNSIGTTDDFYRKLYELNFIADIPVAGQTVWPVANGARRFISQYANDISDTIEIEGDIYSHEEVIEELNEGRPVVIGFNELFGEVNFHNVVAYGYAKYKGVDGYIVHWGRFYDKSFVWVPESWVGFQITMKVNHTHDYQPSFYDVSSVYRKLICTSCGCTTISPLYTVDTEANSILYSNYYMFGNVELPSSIQGVEIKHIQDFAFQDNDKLTSINIPEGVVSIGDFVFNNCINLYEIILPSTLEYIGANAFSGCQNLRSISWPSKVNTIKEGVFKNCAKFVNIFANLQF